MFNDFAAFLINEEAERIAQNRIGLRVDKDFKPVEQDNITKLFKSILFSAEDPDTFAWRALQVCHLTDPHILVKHDDRIDYEVGDDWTPEWFFEQPNYPGIFIANIEDTDNIDEYPILTKLHVDNAGNLYTEDGKLVDGTPNSTGGIDMPKFGKSVSTTLPQEGREIRLVHRPKRDIADIAKQMSSNQELVSGIINREGCEYHQEFYKIDDTITKLMFLCASQVDRIRA